MGNTFRNLGLRDADLISAVAAEVLHYAQVSEGDVCRLALDSLSRVLCDPWRFDSNVFLSDRLWELYLPPGRAPGRDADVYTLRDGELPAKDVRTDDNTIHRALESLKAVAQGQEIVRVAVAHQRYICMLAFHPVGIVCYCRTALE